MGGDAEADVAVAGDLFEEVADDGAGIVGEAGAVEPVADGGFGNPVLVVFDVTRNAAFLGVDGAVGLGAKLDDAEDVHFPAALEGLVVEVGDDALHGVAFVAGAGACAAEGLGVGAVGVDEVGLVFIDDVHHAQGPPGGIPLGVGGVVLKDAVGRGAPAGVGGFDDAFVFAEIDAVEQAWVEAFPPLALAIGEGEMAVIGNTGLGVRLCRHRRRSATTTRNIRGGR